jgi:ATP/maltotriose-dependent transcriptional regulator MalT
MTLTALAPASSRTVTVSVRLSERDIFILKCLADGDVRKQIAEKLRIAHGTLKFHMDGLYKRLGVSTMMEAVVKAMRLGLLE